MSRHEYFLYKSAYRELQKQADKQINADNPQLRYKNLYVQTYEAGSWKDCNIDEVRELKKRRKLEEWLLGNDLLKQLLLEEAVAADALDPAANERFMGLLLHIADVKRRELAGSHEENLADIITD